MHDVLIVTVPLVAILAGILFNRSDMHSFRSEFKGEIKELRSEMKSQIGELRSEMKSDIGELRSEMKSDIGVLRSEMNARFDRVDAELRYFYGLTGKLDGRIEAIEKR